MSKLVDASTVSPDTAYKSLYLENEKFKRALEIAKKSLGFYAGEKGGASYSMERPYFYPILPFDDCDTSHRNSSKDYPMEVGGKRARQALKEIEEVLK